MNLREALGQIDAIRSQMERTATFRGYRSFTVGSTGLIAIAAAAWQGWAIARPVDQLALYLELWLSVAALSIFIVGSELALRWRQSDSPLARQLTARAVEQFLPCVVAGGAMTWAIAAFAPEHAALLPGLWGIVFSLGVFASCRQLPKAAVLVGVYYLLAGVVCLAVARGEYALHPLAMAGTFGAGQLFTAGVLYGALERGEK